MRYLQFAHIFGFSEVIRVNTDKTQEYIMNEIFIMYYIVYILTLLLLHIQTL